MASVLKDPSVVEHVGKKVAAAEAAARKALLKELAEFHKEHAGGIADKGHAKAVAGFHKAFQAHAKVSKSASE